jgi:methylated-DNA-[protein]-cysteine S-methyltransferase
MKTDCELEIYLLSVRTAEGEFMARYSTKGLCGLEFPRGAGRPVRGVSTAKPPLEIRRWHSIVTEALTLALAGKEPTILPPLDFSAGTAFQQRVWRTLRRIACGQTWSYARVADSIGNSKAVRAVGGACGANPIPVLVPCHRVVASTGLGGFSGGLHWKRTLLEREGSLKI